MRYVARWSFDFQREEIFRREQYRFETDAPAPFIVDCGANIGMATLYFKSLYPDATVLAFEPDPAAFACLQEKRSSSVGCSSRERCSRAARRAGRLLL